MKKCFSIKNGLIVNSRYFQQLKMENNSLKM